MEAYFEEMKRLGLISTELRHLEVRLVDSIPYYLDGMIGRFGRPLERLEANDFNEGMN